MRGLTPRRRSRGRFRFAAASGWPNWSSTSWPVSAPVPRWPQRSRSPTRASRRRGPASLCADRAGWPGRAEDRAPSVAGRVL